MSRRILSPQQFVGRAGLYLLLFGFAAVTIFPFLWTGYVSLLKDPTAIEEFPRALSAYGLDNFVYLFDQALVGAWYFNSTVVTVSIVVANLLLNTMAGYALARLRFPGKQAIFLVVVGVMLIPIQVTMVPVYILLARVGLINTHLGLIVPFMVNSFGIFLMRQFFVTVPQALEDAGIMDGLTHYGVFARIMFPLSQSSLLTQFIIIFMWNWNNFLFPSIIVNQERMFTLPIGINTIKSQFFSIPTRVMAGVMVLTIPVVILYLIFQRWVIKGVAQTGIKA